MLTLIIANKNKLFNILKIIVFLLLFVYSISNLSYIYSWFFNIQALVQQKEALEQQNINIKKDIQKLQFKVKGLTEGTINLDLLENQVKSLLNIYNKNEIIILY
jgi:cell division protein FtsB